MSGDDLRARLLAHPDDVEAHLVYADWLQAQGHPQGELIILHHAHLDRPGSRELAIAQGRVLGRNWHALMGALGDPGGVERRWHLGFIRSARIYDDGEPITAAELIETLVGLDTALLLEELAVERADKQPTLDDAIAAIKRTPPPNLRRLSLGNWRLPAIGELRGLDEKLPRLRALELHGPLDDSLMAALTRTRWRLTELILVPSGDYEHDEDDFIPEPLRLLLSSPALASLERLGLEGGYSHAIARAVREAFPRLRLLPRTRP